ncbi:hypothetical protein HDZ31DRAFT_68037 [Schizophyllum fasciatum]
MSDHVPRIPAELVSLIAGFATPRSQANLAQACKSFASPALAALWATQSIASLLLNVLPRGTVLVSPHESFAVIEIYPGGAERLTDYFWARVASYGERIRHVSIPDTGHTTVHLSNELIRAWLSYAERHARAPALCPGARSVDLEIRDPFSAHREFPCVLRHGLHSLRIRNHVPPQLQHILVETLRAWPMTALVDLCVGRSAMLPRMDVDHGVLPLVRHSSLLVDVNVGPVSAACVYELAKLPALRSLRLACAEDLNMNTNGCDLFPVLENLTILATPLGRAVKLLCMSGSPRKIKSLIVDYVPDVFNYGFEHPIGTLGRTIVSCCENDSLVNLQITDRSVVTPDGTNPPYVTSYEHLSALEDLRGLQILSLSWRGYTSLDDREVDALVSSWPALRTLMIDPVVSCPNVPAIAAQLNMSDPIRITPLCLQYITLHCPHLQHLTIPFGPLPHATTDVFPTAISRIASVRSLRIHIIPAGIWQVDDMDKLALFLTSSFPSLPPGNLTTAFAIQSQNYFAKTMYLMAETRRRENVRQQQIGRSLYRVAQNKVQDAQPWKQHLLHYIALVLQATELEIRPQNSI